MNLYTLPDALLNDKLLYDGTWQKADFYDLNTNSSFWNRACITTLSKTYTQDPTAAIIYLLQKECKALKIWERAWANISPTIPDFINFILTEKRFSNPVGKPISAESFWQEYTGTINGITAEAGFEFTLNEIQKPYEELLQLKDIKNIICFDNTWQEQNYFIETEKEWILYHWTTAT